jgi:flagellar hook-basal body complex protein FliE
MEPGMNGTIAAAQAGIEAQVEALSQPLIRPALSANESGGSVAESFAHSLAQAINGVDDKERVADDKMAAVDSGRSDDLVGAMLASQEASLSFSLLMQVRNKVVGAMDDLLKLQL